MLAKTIIPDINNSNRMTFWTEVMISEKEKVIPEGLISVGGFFLLTASAIAKLENTCTKIIKRAYFI